MPGNVNLWLAAGAVRKGFLMDCANIKYIPMEIIITIHLGPCFLSVGQCFMQKVRRIQPLPRVFLPFRIL